jgi:hypothetical protein
MKLDTNLAHFASKNGKIGKNFMGQESLSFLHSMTRMTVKSTQELETTRCISTWTKSASELGVTFMMDALHCTSATTFIGEVHRRPAATIMRSLQIRTTFSVSSLKYGVSAD